MPTLHLTSRRAIAASILALCVAACTPKHETPPGVAIDGPWIRATQPGAQTAAGYVTLTNTGSRPDRLVGVATPAAAMAHLHESKTVDGMAQMAGVSALDLPPGKAVALAPGGYHIMFMDLAGPLAAGDRALVSLTFEKAGTVTIAFPVTNTAPDTAEHNH
jgi:hypothetical protein